MNEHLLKVLEVLGKEINNLEIDKELKDYEITKLKETIKKVEEHAESYYREEMK